MKEYMRQLHIELKSIKKGDNFIIEYVLCLKEISNSLLVVGDVVLE